MIGNNAFYECVSLRSITFPEGLTTIGKDAFHGCSGLQSLRFPESLTSLGKEAFFNCSLSSVDIPQGVTTIPRGAFNSCRKLTVVTIRGNITGVDYCAFQLCINLKYIYCYAESVPYLDSEAMHNCNQSIDLYVRKDLNYQQWEDTYPNFITFTVSMSAFKS